jgi:hypothetical protein
MILKYCDRCKTRLGAHNEIPQNGEIHVLFKNQHGFEAEKLYHYCDPCMVIVHKAVLGCEINKEDEGYPVD